MHKSSHEMSIDLNRSWRARQILDALLSGATRRGLVPKGVRVVLAVVGVSKTEMTKLNFKHRGIKTPTDVLSFEQIFGESPKGYLFLGDLVICDEVLKRQAREQKHSIRAELAVLLVHGFLHLLGWDHERSTREAQKMARLEDALLAGIARHCKLPTLRSGLITRIDAKE